MAGVQAEGTGARVAAPRGYRTPSRSVISIGGTVTGPLRAQQMDLQMVLNGPGQKIYENKRILTRPIARTRRCSI